MKRYMMLPAVAVGVAVGAGCSLVSQPALHHPAPAMAACPPGEVVVVDGAPVGCDLIGGANTLTLQWPDLDGYDYAVATGRSDDAGCAGVELRNGVPTGTGCDF